MMIQHPILTKTVSKHSQQQIKSKIFYDMNHLDGYYCSFVNVTSLAV